MMEIRIGIVWVSLLMSTSQAYQMFQERIPNGNNVPHPCREGKWNGVGHENEMGGGARNIFGKEFKENNLVWNAAICNKDSDGDGRTNGEELGDPDCEWKVGTTPKFTTSLSHPGICEPFSLEQCGGQPSYVNCDEIKKCDVIKDPETFNYTVKFDEVPVPAQETTYMCITIEFPTDDNYHLVAYEPIIDNGNVMHHTLVYGCENVRDAPPSPLLEPKECGGEMRSCTSIIALWSVGMGGECYNDQMGFLVGKTGFKYAIMQVHWNNPYQKSDYVDSSGMVLYLTPKLRLNNAGVFMIGQMSLDIPPGVQSVVQTGQCPGSCTSQIMDGPIYVSIAINHMHLLGKAQRTDFNHSHDNDDHDHVSPVADDKVYYYNTPVLHIHNPPVMLYPGDGIETTCHFSSVNRTTHTKFGQATSDEMCFSFLTYYPKENVRDNNCVSWNSLNYCEYRYQDVIRGCDTAKMADISNPETAKILSIVNENCKTDECTPECLEQVRELKKHACFVGDVGKFFRRSLLRYDTLLGNQISFFFQKFDSCDYELARKNEEIDDGNTSGACRYTHNLMTSFVLCSIAIAVNALGLFV